jgi:hypothetical protein
MTVESTEWSADSGGGDPVLPSASSRPVTEASIHEILRQQQQARRRNFWFGFVAIAVLGSLWAALIREPVDGNFFDGGPAAEPALIDGGFEPDDIAPIMTTTAPEPFETAPETLAPTNAVEPGPSSTGPREPATSNTTER